MFLCNGGVQLHSIITKKTPIYAADKAAGFAHETSNIHTLGEKQIKISINQEHVIYMQLLLQTCFTFSA